MNPTILGGDRARFLNQVPTLILLRTLRKRISTDLRPIFGPGPREVYRKPRPLSQDQRGRAVDKPLPGRWLDFAGMFSKMS